MDKLMRASDILPYFKEGSTLATVGFSLMGAAGSILNEIEHSYLSTGTPRNLTLLHASGQSDRADGIQRLAHKGLVRRIIGAHWGLAPKWGKLIAGDEVEAFCLPQGQIVHLFRAMAGGKPGTFSKIGLSTFVDPRLEGGKMNESAVRSGEEVVERVSLFGEEYLFYKSQRIDVAVLRGTTADESGNITMEEEASKLEMLSVAQAAKANGGKVFVQVKYIARRGSLHPKDVVIPGILVDGVVLAEDPEREHRMTHSYAYHPAYTGDLREPDSIARPMPLDVRKIIGRRAAMELFPGAIVNVGTGIPGDTIGAVAAEEGVYGDTTITIESGAIGGVPAGGVDFGIVKNAEAILEHGAQFDYYHGCGVDVTFMGLAEADREGNVNVSKFGDRTMGCGGFIDITQSARKVVFCATFTTGGLEVRADDSGLLRIEREGRVRKFVDRVGQVTFSGRRSRELGQQVLFVTERAVFELTDVGIELVEIAPGIDLERDVLEQMAFRPIVSPRLALMDARVFREEPMGLAARFRSMRPFAASGT